MPNNLYFDTVFATSGDLTSVPDATQTNGSVSYTQGFPILYSTPVNSGGFNFPRAAHNQILNDITAAIQNLQQNGIPPFITSTMNGGSPYSYSANAIVLYSGVAYQSLVSSNTDTPPSAKWKVINVNSTQAVTGSSHTYVAADSFVQTLRSNSGTLMTDTLPGTSPGVLGNYWTATVVNADSSALLQLAPGSGANLNGSSTATIILGPGQRATLFSDGANYWTQEGGSGRIRLGANTTLYVSPDGSDSNSGLSASSPWATLSHAYNWCQQNVDLNGFAIIAQLAAGTFTSGPMVQGPLVGATNPFSFVFNGNSSSPASYIISTTNANGAQGNNGAQFCINGIQIQTTTSGNGILAQDPGTLIYFENIIAGPSAGAKITGQLGGKAQAVGNYSSQGNAEYHLLVTDDGAIQVNSVTVTESGTPAYSLAYAASYISGLISATNNTYSGSATGSRYSVASGGGINTGGNGANYFPGNSSGSATSPGYYN